MVDAPIAHLALRDASIPVLVNVTANSSSINATLFAARIFQPLPALFPTTLTINATSAMFSGTVQVKLPLGGISSADAADFTVNLLSDLWPAGAPSPFAGPGFGDPEPVDQVQSVGSFRRFSSLSFSPSLAGQPATLSFSVTPSMRTLVGDTLSVSLPGFSLSAGAVSASIASTSSSASGAAGIFSASWSARTGVPTLHLKVITDVPRQTQIDVVVDADQGIQLPASGVTRDDGAFTIRSDAKVRPMLTPLTFRFSTWSFCARCWHLSRFGFQPCHSAGP
eukprot:2632009-Rhodomonas_salina.3